MGKTTAKLIVKSGPNPLVQEVAPGGVSFDLMARGSVGWTLSSGTAPSTGSFEFDARLFDAMARMTGAECELEVRVGGGAPWFRVRGLTILQVISSGDPFTAVVVVADRRWLWLRRHVLRRYNVRRRTGNLVLVREDQLGNVQDFDKVGYAAWSLHGGRPWKPSEILADVVNVVEGGPTLLGLPPGAFRDEMQVQDLEIDDDGATAIARVLGYMPGIDATVNLDGNLRFYSKVDLSEEIVVKRASPLVVGTGFPRMSENSFQRPKSVTYLFTRMVEVRLDGVENRTVLGPFIALDNVLQVTDPSLVVGDRTVLRGTWITVDEAIAAWAKLPIINAATGPLTLDIVRQAWNPGFQCFLRPWTVFPNGASDPVWSARISSLLAHYRRTYRIRRKILDRIYEMDARRVGVFDTATGTRASSLAWTDYTLSFSDVGAVKLMRALERGMIGAVVVGYKEKLDSGHVSPVSVSIMDAHVGLVRLGYNVDPTGLLQSVFPGSVDELPSIDPTGQHGPAFWNQIPRGNKVGTRMTKEHGVAIVITVIPGAPNGLDQLEAVTITAADADARLKRAGIDASVAKSDGPPMQVRVNPGMISAEFAWIDTDAHAAIVSEMLALEDDSGKPKDPALLIKRPIDAAWINESACREFALASAAAMYVGLADRRHGSMGTLLNPSVVVAGSISSVSHSLLPNGAALTSLSMPQGAPAELQALSFMSPATRALVLRSVMPE